MHVKFVHGITIFTLVVISNAFQQRLRVQFFVLFLSILVCVSKANRYNESNTQRKITTTEMTVHKGKESWKNAYLFLYALVQINSKVCRADLFFTRMCLFRFLFCVCVFRLIFHFDVFHLSVCMLSACLESVLLLLFFSFPVKMDNNKITRTKYRLISFTLTPRDQTIRKRNTEWCISEWTTCEDTEPIPHTVYVWYKDPDSATLPLFILSIVKIQNKSHVRAHNVLQTSKHLWMCMLRDVFLFC